MNSKIIFMFFGAVLSGCATGNIDNKSQQNSNNSVNQSGTNSNSVQISESATLKDLYEPGMRLTSTRVQPGKLITKYDEVPSFTDTPENAEYCVAGAASNYSFVDRPSFDETMRLGQSISQKRAVWKFNLDKTVNAENKYTNGRYAQANQNRVKQREQNSNVLNRSGRVNSKKLLDIFGLGKDKKANNNDSPINDYETLKSNIGYNKNILDKQDKQLIQSENVFSNQLAKVYKNSYQNLLTSKDLSFENINQFSTFYHNHIFNCINSRVAKIDGVSPEAKESLNQTYSAFTQSATQLVNSSSEQTIAKFKAAKSSQELQNSFMASFGTPELKQLAMDNAAISTAFKQRSAFLFEEEKKRELENQRLIAAENARKEKLAALELQKKIKNNGSPSTDDIMPVLINKSLEGASNAYKSGGETLRTGANSYDVYMNVLGARWKIVEAKININNLNCKKDSAKQICTYDESSEIKNVMQYSLFGDLAVNKKTQSRTNTFYWQKQGLAANDIQVAYPEPASPEARRYKYKNEEDCRANSSQHEICNPLFNSEVGF